MILKRGKVKLILFAQKGDLTKNLLDRVKCNTKRLISENPRKTKMSVKLSD